MIQLIREELIFTFLLRKGKPCTQTMSDVFLRGLSTRLVRQCPLSPLSSFSPSLLPFSLSPALLSPNLLSLPSLPFPPSSAAEAIHVANMLARHGFFFSVEGLGIPIRDDGTLYRFQVREPLTTRGMNTLFILVKELNKLLEMYILLECTNYWNLQIIRTYKLLQLLILSSRISTKGYQLLVVDMEDCLLKRRMSRFPSTGEITYYPMCDQFSSRLF